MCGPSWASQGAAAVRARPPRVACASWTTTSAPASAQATAAVSPARPPPMIVIGAIPMLLSVRGRAGRPARTTRTRRPGLDVTCHDDAAGRVLEVTREEEPDGVHTA